MTKGDNKRTTAKKTPAEREAEKAGTITVVYEPTGDSYELPDSADDWPFEVSKLADQGKESLALLALLGDQADAWENSDPRPTGGTAREFFRAYVEALGFDPPGN